MIWHSPIDSSQRLPPVMALAVTAVAARRRASRFGLGDHPTYDRLALDLRADHMDDPISHLRATLSRRRDVLADY